MLRCGVERAFVSWLLAEGGSGMRETCFSTHDLWHCSGASVGGRVTAHEMVAFSFHRMDIFRERSTGQYYAVRWKWCCCPYCWLAKPRKRGEVKLVNGPLMISRELGQKYSVLSVPGLLDEFPLNSFHHFDSDSPRPCFHFHPIQVYNSNSTC
jgi:hypothetical protein